MQTASDTPLPPQFHRLAWANLAAQSAEQISLAAVPLVAVLTLGAGAGATGLLAAAQTLPFLLLSIPAGLLADRGSRQRLMLGAEGLRALVLLLMLLALVGGQISVPLLALLGFIGASGTVAFSVAAPSLVPALVPREALPAANSRLELARSLAFAAGPALAGALVAWAGAAPAFVLATLMSGLALQCLRGLREPPRAALPPRQVWRDLAEGAALLRREPLLRPILWTTVVWNLAWFVMQAAYVPYAVHSLGLSASGVGGTLAVYGGGMVLGAVLAPRLFRRLPFGLALLVGPVVSVLAAGLMAATIWWPRPALAAASFFLFGAGPVLWTVAQTTLRQTLTPGPLLGRVSALFMTASAGARPLGATLGALVGMQWGLEACLLLAAAGFVLQALVIVLSPLPALQTLPPVALQSAS